MTCDWQYRKTGYLGPCSREHGPGGSVKRRGGARKATRSTSDHYTLDVTCMTYSTMTTLTFSLDTHMATPITSLRQMEHPMCSLEGSDPFAPVNVRTPDWAWI
jgi:hypothetical protein